LRGPASAAGTLAVVAEEGKVGRRQVAASTLLVAGTEKLVEVVAVIN